MNVSFWATAPLRRRRRRAIALFTAVATAFAVATVPAPSAAAPPSVTCSLSPSGSAVTGESGAGSCVQVTAKLDRPPRVGETAQLRVTVRADRAFPAASVQIDLPDGWRWLRPPQGLGVGAARTEAAGGSAAVQRADGRVDLVPGTDRVYAASVVADKPGFGTLRARAAADPHRGDDTVFVTVGETDSHFGYRDAGQSATAVPAGATVAPNDRALPFKKLARARLATPHTDDPAGPSTAAINCTTGRWTYLEGGTLRPSRNFQVQAWDEDGFGDDLLATGLTDGDGRFRLCFSNDDGPFSGGQDLYLRFVAENGQWNVEEDDDEPWEFRSDRTFNNVGNGATTDFGTLQPTDNNLHRALRAYDAANDASTWTPGDCWDARDDDCRLTHIRWRPDSNTGAFYCPTDDYAGCDADDTVMLRADTPNTPEVVVHELGHAVMDDAFDEVFPDIPNCDNHAPNQARSAGCAWVEGFADWYAMAVYNMTTHVGWEHENRHWGDDWPTGDTVQGRITGSLLDIADAANAAPGNLETWDRYTEGAPGRIWDTLLDHRSRTFREFWNNRVRAGYDSAPERALGCLFQNTIDYGFRDPIGDGTVFARPEAHTAHNYRIDTTKPFWSVVAVRPEAGNDHDLAVYDDNAQTQLLRSSAAFDGTIDFVGIDSNTGHRPAGDYYPRVTRVSGTGGYRIQYAQATLLTGSDAITMPAGDVVAVRDVLLTAGTQVTITVTPSNAGQDPELFVLDSTDASDTWLRSRASAVASSVGNGPGAAEQIVFTPRVSGFHGLVLTNVAGAGTYTVQVS